MCALVKPKDIPFETECLEKRLGFIKNLKDCLQKESRLVTATVDLYSELIEDILQDVCVDVHRDVMTHPLVEDAPDEYIHLQRLKESSEGGMGKGGRNGIQEGGLQKRKRLHAGDGHQKHLVEEDEPEKQEEETMEKVLAKAAIHYGSANMLGIQMSGSKGAVDMFGNMVQPVALDQVTCPNCERKIASGRFAPHLEKCMGGGRLAGRTSKVTTHSVSK